MNDVPPSAADAPQLRTLLLTDLCDSTALVERIGDAAAAELFRDHDRLVLQLQQQWRGRLIDRSDGLLLLFERPIDGLGFALDYAQGLRTLGERRGGLALRARQGLHVGEVLTWRNSDEAVQVGAKPLEVEGLAKPTAARLMSIARPGQLLLSAVAETLTHRAARGLGERGERLLWKSHGRWRFKGVPTPMEIYEVGEIGLTPLRAPRHSPKAWRDIPLWRRPAALVAELAVLAVLGVGIWFITRAQPAIAFAERDWVVVGDLRNMTDNATLDGALDQAFRISLEQSRYLNILSEERVIKSMTFMRKDPLKDPLDRKNASDVALRVGARAVLMPSVADVGGRTRFVVEIVDPGTQQTMAVSSAYGAGPAILGAVDKVTADLRGQLGEDADHIHESSPPLPEVTTASLDALRAYALGQRRYAAGDYVGAQGFYRKATELDPRFALAWLGQVRAYFADVDYARATSALKMVVGLDDRLPPREAMYVKSWAVQIQDPAAAADAWVQMAEIYPDYPPAQHNAAMDLFVANRFKEALPFARRATGDRFDLSAVFLDQYGRILLALGDYAAADRALAGAVAAGWNGALLRHAAAVAARHDFAGARKLLAQVDRTNFHADLTRIAVALDQGDLAYALERARHGMAASDQQQGVAKLNYYVPLATAYLAFDDKAAAARTAHEGAREAIRALAKEDPVDALDDATTALAAALVAVRAGDPAVAADILRALAAEPARPDTRLVRELTAVVEAEQQIARAQPTQGLARLAPFLDQTSRFQTRVTAMRAAMAARDEGAARAQANWIVQRRGMAYAEIQCGYCLQALNVLDMKAATKVAAALK